MEFSVQASNNESGIEEINLENLRNHLKVFSKNPHSFQDILDIEERCIEKGYSKEEVSNMMDIFKNSIFFNISSAGYEILEEQFKQILQEYLGIDLQVKSEISVLEMFEITEILIEKYYPSVQRNNLLENMMDACIENLLEGKKGTLRLKISKQVAQKDMELYAKRFLRKRYSEEQITNEILARAHIQIRECIKGVNPHIQII